MIIENETNPRDAASHTRHAAAADVPAAEPGAASSQAALGADCLAVVVRDEISVQHAPGAVLLLTPEGCSIPDMAVTPKAAFAMGVRLIHAARRATDDIDKLYAQSSVARD